jgi:hypothetical protein
MLPTLVAVAAVTGGVIHLVLAMVVLVEVVKEGKRITMAEVMARMD